MIFPFLRGFTDFEQAPITWIIVLFNVMIFLTFFPQQFVSNQQLNTHLSDSYMQQTQAQVYLSYLQELPVAETTPQQKRLLEKYSEDPSSKTQALRFAMQDTDFLNEASALAPRGDAVAFKHWQEWIDEFKKINEVRPLSIFGLSSSNGSWMGMLTYQYLHANFMHLFTNMLVLLIFGAALEVALGSFTFLLLYTAAGVAGAFAFVQLSGLGVAPLVGASAAVSGLIAFYAVNERRKRICFVYLLAPVEGYYGFIYLPTLLILPVCFFSDLAAIIQQGASFGGIAYAAHLGGACLGTIIGLAYGPLLAQSRRQTSA